MYDLQTQHRWTSLPLLQRGILQRHGQTHHTPPSLQRYDTPFTVQSIVDIRYLWKPVSANCNFFLAILTFFSELGDINSQFWEIVTILRYKLAIASSKFVILRKKSEWRNINSQFWEIVAIVRKVTIARKKLQLRDLNSQF